MFPPKREKFVNESIAILQKDLIKLGIVIRRPELLKDTVIKIGELYHDTKKEEEF